jgi:glycosyltransferase involved in cell wall biosynthesis
VTATVDIILRTRNRPLLLARALAGIVAQTHQDWCVHLVNDGGDPAPVDRCVAALGGAAERVRVQHNATSVDRSPAFIQGWKAGTAPFVAWHDDDDRWHTDFLASMVPALATPTVPGTSAAVAWVEEIHERIDGETVVELRRGPWSPPFHAVPLWRLAQRNVAPPIAMLLRRTAVDAVGGLDPALPLFEDWDLLLRLHRRGEIAVVPRVLAEYRIRPGAGGDAANAVSDHVRMAQWEALIRNRHTRADADGTGTGLGTLLQSVDAIADARDRAIQQASPWRALWRRLCRLTGRR